MSDETKCQKCGAAMIGFEGVHGGKSWFCGSVETVWPVEFKQADRCRITQLEQQLAVAVAALSDISKCIGTPELIAAEALKQIGATDDR